MNSIPCPIGHIVIELYPVLSASSMFHSGHLLQYKIVKLTMCKRNHNPNGTYKIECRATNVPPSIFFLVFSRGFSAQISESENGGAENILSFYMHVPESGNVLNAGHIPSSPILDLRLRYLI
jgi:hypothetical protein